MTEYKFIDYDGISLFSNCLVFQNEKNKKVHLLPVIHLGSMQYYSGMQDYIENRICIYEEIKTGQSDINQQKSIKNLDEFIDIMSPEVEKFWEPFKSLLKRFYKNFINKDTKNLWKRAKKEIKHSDEKIRIIYDICVKSFFGIHNIFPIQLYLSEIMNLEQQQIAIDYENDIQYRSNWILTDLNSSEQAENIDMSEIIEEYLTEPTREIIEVSQKEIIFLLSLILFIVGLKKITKVSKRREVFATNLIQGLTLQFEASKELLPDYLLDPRNSMIENQILNLIEDHEEIIVFYGVAHMVALERFLLDQGFSLKNQQSFEVFKIEE